MRSHLQASISYLQSQLRDAIADSWETGLDPSEEEVDASQSSATTPYCSCASHCCPLQPSKSSVLPPLSSQAWRPLVRRRHSCSGSSLSMAASQSRPPSHGKGAKGLRRSKSDGAAARSWLPELLPDTMLDAKLQQLEAHVSQVASG